MTSPPSVNPITQRIYDLMAPAVVGDAEAGYPWLSWLDGIGAVIQPLADLIEDTPDGDPGWSILLDVARCPTAALPWLGQFVGVSVDTSLTDAAQRLQIQGEAGFKRGTPAALIAGVIPYLVRNKVVHLVERSADAYTFELVVYSRDLQGGRWIDLIERYATWDAVMAAYPTWDALLGDVGASLAAVVDKAKPAGLIQTLTIASGGDWADVVANFATWDAVVANFATWDALLAWTPPS